MLKIKLIKSYSLIELIAVFVVLAIVALIIIPTFTTVETQAKQSSVNFTASQVLKESIDLARYDTTIPSSINKLTGSNYLYQAFNDLQFASQWELFPNAASTNPHDSAGNPLLYTIEPIAVAPLNTNSNPPIFACIMLPSELGGTGSVASYGCSYSKSTPPPPNSISTAPLSPVSVTGASVGTTINVSWQPNQASVPINGYMLERAPAADPSATTLVTMASPTQTTFSDVGVSPGTYVYSVVSFNNIGVSSPPALSNSIVVYAAPGAPANLSGTLTGYSIALSWGAPTTGGPALAYEIYRSVNSGAYSLLATEPVGTTAYVDNNLPVGPYKYEVYASNLTGTSPASNPAIFTVIVPPPRNLSVSVQNSTPTLTWNPPLTGGTPAAYLIYDLNSATLLGTVAGTVTTFTANTFPAGAYGFGVEAENTAGAVSSATTASSTIYQAPASPTNLVGTSMGQTVNLTWTPPSGTVDSYLVYENNALITTTPGDQPFASIKNVPIGTQPFEVAAVNNGGTSGQASTTVLVYPPPNPPYNLQASVIGYNVTLTWQQPVTSTPVNTFVVYQGTTKIGTVAAPTNATAATLYSFVQPEPVANKYNYSVIATNYTGNSTPSITSATVVVPPPVNLNVAVSNDNSALTWHAPLTGGTPTTYLILKNGALLATLPGTTTSYLDSAAGFGSMAYSVEATDATGQTSLPITQTVVINNLPGIPTSLAAPATGTTINFSWAAPTSGGAPDVYNVFFNNSLVAENTASQLTLTESKLSPGTYSFGVSATNNGGTGQEATVSGTVLPVPTAVVGLAGSQVNYNASLTWQQPTGGAGDASITAYLIYKNGALVGTNTPSQLSYVDLNANPGSYSYSVAAQNLTGVGPSASIPLTLIEYPPTNLAASIANAQVTLTWQQPLLGGSPASYLVLRGGGLVGTVSGTTLTYLDTTTSAGNTYNYAVESENINGSPSTPVSVSATVSQGPGSPTNFAGVPKGTTAYLTWSPPASGGTPTAYLLERNGALIATMPISQLSYNDPNLAIGTTYPYTLYAENNAGLSAPASTNVVFPSAPGTPTISVATTGQTDSVTWAASTQGGPATSFILSRTTTSTTPVTLYSGAGTSYQDSNLLPNTYTYSVVAYNSSASSQPATDQATVSGLPPTNLYVASTGSSSIVLDWTQSTSSGVSGYRITYTTPSSTAYASVGVTSTATISGLTPGVTYSFYAQTVFTNGTYSGNSNVVSGSPTLPALTGLSQSGATTTSITASWSPSAIAGVEYELYVGGNWCYTYSTSCTVSAGLSAGSSYTMFVQYVSSGTTSPASSQLTAYTTPNAPPSAGDTPSQTQITYYWGAVSGAVYYEVYNPQTGTYNITYGTSYTIGGYAANNSYTAYVYAVGYYNNSAWTTMTGTTLGCASGSANAGGTYAYFTLPAYCNTVTITAVGESGQNATGAGAIGTGGGGAYESATFNNALLPGEYLLFQGSYPGYDAGYQGNYTGGNGGGSSGMWEISPSSTPILVAAGGGGGGNTGAGATANGGGGGALGWASGGSGVGSYFGGGATSYSGGSTNAVGGAQNGACNLTTPRYGYIMDIGGHGYSTVNSYGVSYGYSGGGGGGGICGGAGGGDQPYLSTYISGGGGGGYSYVTGGSSSITSNQGEDAYQYNNGGPYANVTYSN